MDGQEVEMYAPIEDGSNLNRNRSFKSKQLVRSQAIRESTSPPRTVSPSIRNEAASDNVSLKNVNVNKVNVKVTAVDRTDKSESSQDSDVYNYKEDMRKPVEIQITQGTWDEGPPYEQCGRTRRWLSDSSRESTRDLLSNNPRVACVCGSCAACPHCRGRRRRHICTIKQDSGCPDECPDCCDTEPSAERKAGSLDAEEQYYCRCPERRDKPKSMLTRNDSGEDDKSEPTGPELVAFVKDTLNKNSKDRMTLLRVEKELYSLVNDTGRCIVKFPVMTSYGRMLVHRCASLFQLSHYLDTANKNCVVVSKSGTCGGRIPCTSFKTWCVVNFPPQSPQRHQAEHTMIDGVNARSILKRDAHSLDEPASCALSMNRSKSLEQREKEYERVRRRIFSSDNCNQDESQWPWISGPVKLLTPEHGRNKLLKVQSLEHGVGRGGRAGGAVSKSHSFGGYGEPQPRALSTQGDLASSSWRLSPSSSGYKTLSLRSTDSVTPSPTGMGRADYSHVELLPPPINNSIATPLVCRSTGGPYLHHVTSVTPTEEYYASGAYNFTDTYTLLPEHGYAVVPLPGGRLSGGGTPEPAPGCPAAAAGSVPYPVVWAVTDMACVPPGALVLHPQTGRPMMNADGSIYHFDPSNPPVIYQDQREYEEAELPKTDQNNDKRRGRLAKQHSFMDHEAECQQAEEYYCEYQPQEVQEQPVEKENIKPVTPVNNHYETHPEPATQPEQASQPAASYGPADRGPKAGTFQDTVYYGPYANMNNIQYGEEVTSSSQLAQYMQTGISNMQSVAPQAKAAPILQDPNISPLSLTNVVYPQSIPPGYQFIPNQCRMSEPMAQLYQPMVGQSAEEQKVPTPPQATDNTFRIDPSYPYAPLDYTATYGGCVDPTPIQAQPPPQRSYSVPYNPAELGGMQPAMQSVMPSVYPLSNVILPQTLQYPVQYQEPLQWTPVQTPAMCPVVYPQHYGHYNILYPQVVPQPYPLCQPIYPVIDKDYRRKRNSLPSARVTPLTPEDKERTQEIAAKINQIKDSMMQREQSRRNDWRKNSGNGILGSYPVNSYNGRLAGATDNVQLTSAARAIVNSIRNLQAKNSYHQERRYDYNHSYQRSYDRPDRRRYEERTDPHGRGDWNDRHTHYERTNYHEKNNFQDRNNQDKNAFQDRIAQDKNNFQDRIVQDKNNFQDRIVQDKNIQDQNVLDKNTFQDRNVQDKNVLQDRSIQDKNAFQDQIVQDKNAFQDRNVQDKNVFQNWNVQDKTFQDRNVQDKTFQDRNVQEKSFQDRSIQDKNAIEDQNIQDKMFHDRNVLDTNNVACNYDRTGDRAHQEKTNCYNDKNSPGQDRNVNPQDKTNNASDKATNAIEKVTQITQERIQEAAQSLQDLTLQPSGGQDKVIQNNVHERSYQDRNNIPDRFHERGHQDRPWHERKYGVRGLNPGPAHYAFRPPYLFRQMSPGSWCRRSPAPVHPGLNPQRRLNPDNRNGRRY